VTFPLTGIEFEALWFMTGRDRMPYPVVHAYPPELETVADVARFREQGLAGLLRKYHPDLVAGMEVLDSPDIRVEMHGFSGPDLSREIRVLAAIRQQRGAVLAQAPDPQPRRSGDLTLTVCEPGDLPRLIVAQLPRFPAGRLDDIRFDRAQLVEEPNEYNGWDRPLTPGERVERIFRRPRAAWGEITCYRGSAIDNRPTGDGRGFFWMHFAGDGGYFVQNDRYIQARPMSTDDTVASLNGLIHSMRHR
jgi:hypothetical protein